MKLTDTQIERLYAFTRTHFVEWYDLQTELVDHLANAIEAKWDENPTLTFDAVLESEFRKFGIFGFSDVVEKRQRALNKRYHKLVWKHFRGFFGIPKIIATLAAVFLVFTILKQIRYSEETAAFAFGLITVVLLAGILITNRKNKKHAAAGKKWLFEEIIKGYGSITAFAVLPFQLMYLFYNSSEAFSRNTWLLSGCSALLVSYAIVAYIIMIFIPSKIKEYLIEIYPEYRFGEV